MKGPIYFIIVLFSLIFLSCSHQQKQNATNTLPNSNEYAEGSDCITISTRQGALVVVETIAD
jgi:ABC-type enterochelin transport system substrate-binding protein